MDDTRIGGILLEASFIKQEDLDRCLQIQSLSSPPKQLGEILIEEGVVTRKVLQQLLAIQQRRRLRSAEQRVPGESEHGVDQWVPDELIERARSMGASDLFLGEERLPRARIAGEIKEISQTPVSSEHLWRIARTLAGPDALERMPVEKDLVVCRRTAGDLNYRISLFRQIDGLSAVIHILPSEARPLRELGHVAVVEDMMLQNRGLILVTGPVGSGKTTTIAAMVARLASTRQARIMILDDGAEIRVPSSESLISYREIGRHAKSYAAALASALREDLDLIVVGQLQDRETIELALQAAETGHLVIASLHSKDCLHALNRLVDSFPATAQPQVRVMLSSVLRGIVAQKLIPGVGGAGRVLATEVMVPNPPMLVLIREGKFNQIPLMMHLNKGHGCLTMDDCLSGLAAEKKISDDDAVTSAIDRARALKSTWNEVPA